jgi:FlaA1/EpsC-like NDP-sugar epimerase
MRHSTAWLFERAAREFEGIPPRSRLVIVTAVQVALIVLGNFIAFLLRFEGRIPQEFWDWMVRGLPFVALVYAIGFWGFGLQRGLWRYVGFQDLKLILWAVSLSTVTLYGVLHGLWGWVRYPRSVIILTGLLGVVFLGGIRFAVRIFREWAAATGSQTTPALIVGAGNAGQMLIRNLQSTPGYNYKPVVVVDDSPAMRRRTVHGVPVSGTIDEIPSLVARYAVREIIIAIPSASPALMRRILTASQTCHLPIKTLPNVKQLLDSPVSMRHVRPMRLDDLLQREPIQTDLQELRPLLEGKRVLVTGAGGSIGSELSRQIARYHPALLVLFERHENSVYALELELRELFPQLNLLAVIGDVTHRDQVHSSLQAARPHLIFHAAAHKHVPLMERNAAEAIRNNVYGTQIVAEAAVAAGVERFVLISTDKAVNPVNVMGATKRIAEFLVQGMNGRGVTRFSVVRFGNVLGSNGSVVPLFAEQIRKGGPVTVTHPDIKRYFMTIPEAVQLILQASAGSRGGDVFVLDMGEQIRIADLARNMIALSGLVPDQDIKMTFTGLRPGEKLYEELFEGDERVEPTVHNKINRAVGRIPFGPGELDRHLKELEGLLPNHSQESLIRKLRAIVSTYAPDGGGRRDAGDLLSGTTDF